MIDVRRAAVLLSGGLDSMLAAKVMQDQGIYIEGLNFFTGFCVEGHTHAIRKQAKIKRNNALWVAEQLGIKLHFIDVIEEYKKVLLNPVYGYGANLNPCLDCKIFMVKKAYEWIQNNKFDFIVTGEVKGQRPMSQRKEILPKISKESGANDLLVRPLCAKGLAPSLPERNGWIDRDKLYDINGRSRKIQMELANSFGIKEYAQPAGGCCFLTDKKYSLKLIDLWNKRGKREYEFDDIILLKVGRHIRPAPNYKLIIAREEGENRFLRGYRSKFAYFETESHPGPLALVDGEIEEYQYVEAAQIVGRYSQGRAEDEVVVNFYDDKSACRQLRVKPMHADDLEKRWIL